MTKLSESVLDAVTPQRIAETAALIAPYVRRTPVIDVAATDLGLSGSPVTFKLELTQRAGVFKVRGAFTNLLTRHIPEPGVAAASGGNHGVAVAYAAMTLGIRARIFVPVISSPAKIARIRSYGVDLVVGGARYADALEASEIWIAQTHALGVHAFDQVETLLGQGTLGHELDEQTPDLDTLLVPVGGGGLIGGIAAWYRNRVRVIGVEPEGAPTLRRALDAGRPIDAETESIAADSLAPRRAGELVFPIARQYVHNVVLVDDGAIRAAQERLWETVRVIAEPGAAAAFAALLWGRYRPAARERVGVVLSGGNTVAVDFTR